MKPFEGIDGEVLYIWGDDMPVTTENVEAGFTVDSYDNADFRPFLVPYLVSDQSQAKGTLIVLSGGGNTTRSNPTKPIALLLLSWIWATTVLCCNGAWSPTTMKTS